MCPENKKKKEKRKKEAITPCNILSVISSDAIQFISHSSHN
jgi:hypothetical protein